MSCNSSCNNSCNNATTVECPSRGHGNGFVIIIVLYILLAIIIGSRCSHCIY